MELFINFRDRIEKIEASSKVVGVTKFFENLGCTVVSVKPDYQNAFPHTFEVITDIDIHYPQCYLR